MYPLRQLTRGILSGDNFAKVDHLVVCFDSDDWGVSRCTSQIQKEALIRQGYSMNNEAFVRCDGLENYSDVFQLISILKKHSDFYGNPPKFTLNFSMFSPDFKKIVPNNFSFFFYQPFFQLYGEEQDAILNLFFSEDGRTLDCQLHGAQHINVCRFLKEASIGIGYAKESALNGLTCIGNCYCKNNIFGYMDELNVCGKKENDYVCEQLVQAKKEFEGLFHKKIDTITPSCGVLPDEVRKRMRSLGFVKIKEAYHYFVNNNKNYTLYKRANFSKKKWGSEVYVRNADFEPGISGGSLEEAKNAVSISFKLGKPCIFCTHRVNYSSRILSENQKSGLSALDALLSFVEKQYPNVEYLSTNECIKKYGKK